MRLDSDIKRDVEDELALGSRHRRDRYWCCRFITASLRLAGFVRSYAQKTEAERDAKRRCRCRWCRQRH